MEIYTIEQFEILYNDYRQKKSPKTFVKKTFPLTKRKTIKKRVTKTVMENGIPSLVEVSPAVTKVVPDTNNFQDLIICYLQLVHGFKARRISSEGRWRKDPTNPNGGRFIKGLNNGLEDIQGIGPGGKIIAIEAKFTKSDTMREKQLQREKDVKTMGGIYIRAKEFETFQRDLLKALNII